MTGQEIKELENCPTCGQELPRSLPLRIDVEIGVAVANGRAVTLTPKEAELLALIVSTGTRVAKYEFLMEGLYLLDEPGVEVLKVVVCKMRKKLAKADIFIETVWGKGFRLSVKTNG